MKQQMDGTALPSAAPLLSASAPALRRPLPHLRPQILQQSHSPLLQLLGKSSGRDVDKEAEARRLGFKVVDAFGLPVLEGQGRGALHSCIHRAASGAHRAGSVKRRSLAETRSNGMTAAPSLAKQPASVL
jgi:hypothetical protein